MALSDYTPLISSIKLPGSNDKYYFKDAYAREVLEGLSQYSKFLGVTTTELEDGSSTNPITINSQSVTATAGCIAIYGSKEFIFGSDSKWAEFGDLSALINSLGDLAYEDTASGTYTPEGSVSVILSTSAQTIEVEGISYYDFSISFREYDGGIGVSIPIRNTLEAMHGSISQPNFGALFEYTPRGIINWPSNPLITTNDSSFHKLASIGTLPSLTGGLISISMGTGSESEVLNITIPNVSDVFSAGTLPTFESESTNFLTGVIGISYGVEAFSFSGVEEGFYISYNSSATFEVSGYFTNNAYAEITYEQSSTTYSGTFAPSVAVSSATFTGSSSTITVSASN